MRINTNVSSLTAQEAAQNTSKSITSSLEKLSTGLRINKSSDDASGLAIADKLRTQATSINQGIANGNSAVSLLQIADKSMGEQSNILDTIKAKLIQANTDTTSDDGRESIRKDIKKLLDQLDNIASQTNYNGTTLLQASAGTDATAQIASNSLNFQIGETEKDIISNDAIRSNTVGLGGGQTDLSTAPNNTFAAGSTMKISGSAATLTPASGATGSITVSGDIGTIAGTSTLTLSDMDDKTRDMLTLMAAADTSNATLTDVGDGTFTVTSAASLDLTGFNVGSMKIVAGAADDTITFNTDKVITVKNNDATNDITFSGTITGGDTLKSLKDVTEGNLTKTVADKFQGVINQAITDLNGYRGNIGSTQNQVESAVRNLMTQATNVKAAESIIRDVDYAQESANFNKQNIISQAGSYAISQANAVQQNVLRLLQ
ncbi:MAG: flagellin [Arcobacter sp.]|uniref:flagellin N-terminal helical domain-containing protein n=1 Tax=Arcobacter sp. TaxID=1872629 RepID=UPI002589F5C2|nr:flagellin [Arcobacter sp.]MDD3008249.1 flagellin [Arcobacter sp.]